MFSEFQFDRVPVDQNSIVSLDILSLIALSVRECITRLVKMSQDESMGTVFYGVSGCVFESMEPFLYLNLITTCNACGAIVEVKPNFSEQIFLASLEVIFQKKLLAKEQIDRIPTETVIKRYIKDNLIFNCNTDCPECESSIYLWSEEDQIVGDSSCPIILKPKKPKYPERYY